MRKVLIVSYHAPPRNVTTAHRIEGLIWNLPKFGWQPIVCSAPPAGFALAKMMKLNSEQNLMAQLAQLKAKLGIYRERSWLDKLATFYGEWFFYPDPMKGWINTMNAQFDFDRYKPDLVMSHSFPHTSHIVASQLNRNRVPWIASFSDLWTDSHFYPYSRFRKERESYLEENTLKKAKCFITPSQPLSDILGERYYQHAFTIPNSYPKTDPQPLTNDFTLTYTGNFYAEKYDLEMFCWTLANYKYHFPTLKVRIYGQPYPFLVRLVHFYHLDDVVKFYPSVSHHDALKAQKESQVLLHFAWNDPKYQGVYSAKLFEYLGAKRPIISFGGADKAVGSLLRQTGAGVWTPTPEDFSHVLTSMFQEYTDCGAVQYHGVESEISEYSVEKMAQRHAELFDRIAK